MNEENWRGSEKAPRGRYTQLHPLRTHPSVDHEVATQEVGQLSEGEDRDENDHHSCFTSMYSGYG
jgi:hypothetical protein